MPQRGRCSSPSCFLYFVMEVFIDRNGLYFFCIFLNFLILHFVLRLLRSELQGFCVELKNQFLPLPHRMRY